MMPCKLSAIQIVSSPDAEQNLRQISQQLSLLPKHSHSPHIVLLPENALCFSSRQDYISLAETLGDGVYQTRLSDLAKQFQCTLICGSFPIKSDVDGKVFTTSLVYSPQGRLIAHYHKIHLFDAAVSDTQQHYRESDTFSAGQSTKVVDCGSVKVGLAICYDLRFPGLFQQLTEQGADVIVVPAAFTKVTGAAHWQTLLQARAIETQCYVVAANQGGEHILHGTSRRSTFGHSMIISPWGEIVGKLEEGNGFVQTSFDRTLLNTVRKKMPVQQHNRFSSIQKFK